MGRGGQRGGRTLWGKREINAQRKWREGGGGGQLRGCMSGHGRKYSKERKNLSQKGINKDNITKGPAYK